MKSKAEIVIETLRYYNIYNRAYNAEYGSCTYLDSESGNKCAVGRVLSNDALEKVSAYEKKGLKEETFDTDIVSLNKHFNNLDDLLLPEYRGHAIKFWQSLQEVHDASRYWNENGFDANKLNLHNITNHFGKDIALAVESEFQ